MLLRPLPRDSALCAHFEPMDAPGKVLLYQLRERRLWRSDLENNPNPGPSGVQAALYLSTAIGIVFPRPWIGRRLLPCGSREALDRLVFVSFQGSRASYRMLSKYLEGRFLHGLHQENFYF